MDVPNPARCAFCIHRPKDDGGKGDCPLPSATQQMLAKRKLIDCFSFKPGDRKNLRVQPKPTQAEALF